MERDCNSGEKAGKLVCHRGGWRGGGGGRSERSINGEPELSEQDYYTMAVSSVW